MSFDLSSMISKVHMRPQSHSIVTVIEQTPLFLCPSPSALSYQVPLPSTPSDSIFSLHSGNQQQLASSSQVPAAILPLCRPLFGHPPREAVVSCAWSLLRRPPRPHLHVRYLDSRHQ